MIRPVLSPVYFDAMRRLVQKALVAWVLVSLCVCPAEERPHTKVILLGTGTPFPNPERSGPATAILVGDRAYLVDFGPGVVRRAAAAAAKGYPAVNPTNIAVAFVTHLHSESAKAWTW